MFIFSIENLRTNGAESVVGHHLFESLRRHRIGRAAKQQRGAVRVRHVPQALAQNAFFGRFEILRTASTWFLFI